MKEGVVLSVKSYLKRHKTDKPSEKKDKNGRKKKQRNDNVKNIDQNLCKKWKNCKFFYYYYYSALYENTLKAIK